MQSYEGESIKFIQPINVDEGEKRGNVERWLLEIEETMQKTMRHLSLKSLKDLDTQRNEWLLKWPAQCVLAIN